MTSIVKQLEIPNFDKIEASTKTIIGVSNLKMSIEELFEKLPVVEYVVIPKKRGRKKKVEDVNPNKDIQPGSIITLKWQDNLRGVDLKQKNNKKSTSSSKYFRNALTIVMYLEPNKLINFKISKNGKFQFTGPKHHYHAELGIKYFWNYIRDDIKSSYTIDDKDQKFRVTFITVMTNIDFNLGFLVNRENLDKYINKFTEYNSLLETSFGYTGVNIKFPMSDKIEMDLKKMVWEDNDFKYEKVKYTDYLENLSEKDKEKEFNKQRYNTFLVFQSGNVIMSGLIRPYMKNIYYDFFNIINKCKNDIEEKISS